MSSVSDAIGSKEGPDAAGRVRARHHGVGGSKKPLPFTNGIVS